ncbi:apolipoprotein D-like [Pectinophora gossypiella]|uniref:Lipocalin/cytosolic fatty-acid binding domain-containing protein n=1 Tax=Pectinophora gossypiella TaxID=13191 RepID=A0A1E1WPJ5_PECGO|nr:apolipoprotein D-like [Pectinophora gossypiella]
MYLAFLGVLLVCGGAYTHTYHLGACPVVEPMPGFEMNKMLGVWYVIQKTSTASHCITYNFTKTLEPGQYQLEQVSQHFILGLTPLKHDYRYTGILTVPDSAVPARMKVRFPLSVAGSASYTILATDYTTYAAVFTCQKLAFAHRRSATILSRNKELDKIFLDKVRTKLSSFGVDPYDLSIISQSNCPQHPNGTTEGVNINIDPGTFSAHNIGNAVKSAGEAIGDGVEYVVDAGKKVYNKVASSKEDLTEAPAGAARNYNADAEWLP